MHSVTVNDPTPSTCYAFDIVCGLTSIANGGAYFDVTTAATMVVTTPDIASEHTTLSGAVPDASFVWLQASTATRSSTTVSALVT